MLLRKIELGPMEGAISRLLSQTSGLGEFFSQRLVLWFDGVSADDKKGLEQLMESYYSLKKEVPLKVSGEEGSSLVCYGQGCLPYEFYDEYRREEIDFSSDYTANTWKLNFSPFHDKNLTLKDAKNMKKIIQRTSESQAHYQYLDYLRGCLAKSSGARLWMTDEPWCSGPHLTRSPEKYNEDFKPAITELVLFPPRQEVLQGLTGFLIQRKTEYETPHHQEIWEGILRGEIKEYLGHAREEYLRQTKKTPGLSVLKN